MLVQSQLQKNIVKDIHKESLLLGHLSHFLPALKAKYVAGIFIAHFENNRSKR